MKLMKIVLIFIALCCVLSAAERDANEDDFVDAEEEGVEEDDAEDGEDGDEDEDEDIINRQEIPIGAMFYHDELYLERAFTYAVRTLNAEKRRPIKLVPVMKRLSSHSDSESLQTAACDLIDNGVAAIFGPSSKMESDIVALICNSTGIPHLQFDMAREETKEENFNHQMTLNLYPYQLILSKAYADIVEYYGWRKFTVIYDEEDASAPARLQDLLQLRDVHNEIVRVRKYKRGMDYRVLWKSVQGERRIVLDCTPDMLVELLTEATDYELTGQFNNLFLTNLETHSADIMSLLDNETYAMNVTAVRLRLNGNLYELEDEEKEELYHGAPDTPVPYRTLLPNLLTDAVTLFADALLNATTPYRVRLPRVRCDFGPYDDTKTWRTGKYIGDIMKAANGVDSERYRVTDMQFDPDGQRVGFAIEIYEPIENYGLSVWNTKGIIHPMHVEKTVVRKIVYRVATRFGEPYFSENKEMAENNVTGNALYKGYAVDLIQALSEELDFEYVFVPVADNQYGKFNEKTKTWNGIIGEIMYNDAHMGICDLTITQARKKAVDFTVPFMQLGISILGFQQPYERKNVFAFFQPFTVDVWIYVLIAIFVMTFAMMLVARIDKEYWENPHPCNKNPETLENMWNVSNMMWLALGSITTAGCDILPKSAPTRCINAMWWIFAIIIANSYTANLAAFLTNSNMAKSIQGIADLAQQTKVKFGTIAGGSTYQFFADSNETTYRLAFNIMNGIDPSAYTVDNAEGVERVKKKRGSYMFLMETTSLEYNLERECDLERVGEKFGEKHYAIAVPLGAEYRSMLSVGILRLSEKGELFNLKNKWWKTPKPCPVATTAETDTPEMTFEEVRGIFYTLAGGVALAYIIGIIEFLMHSHHVAAEEQLTFKEAFLKELLFVLQVWNNKKPISCTPTASRGSSSEKAAKSLSRKKSSTNSSETRDMQSIKSVIKRTGSKDHDKHTYDESV